MLSRDMEKYLPANKFQILKFFKNFIFYFFKESFSSSASLFHTTKVSVQDHLPFEYHFLHFICFF